MKEVIRQKIKVIIDEIFDNISEIPEGLRKEIIDDKIYYKFYHQDLEYAIELLKIKNIGTAQMPLEKMRNYIISNGNGYVVSFGIIKDNQYFDFFNTNKNKATEIIGYIFAIIKKFIEENKVDVITYYAEKSRDNVYKYIFNKHLLKEFIFYTAKENPNYNRFYIKKEFYDKIKEDDK